MFVLINNAYLEELFDVKIDSELAAKKSSLRC